MIGEAVATAARARPRGVCGLAGTAPPPARLPPTAVARPAPLTDREAEAGDSALDCCKPPLLMSVMEFLRGGSTSAPKGEGCCLRLALLLLPCSCGLPSPPGGGDDSTLACWGGTTPGGRGICTAITGTGEGCEEAEAEEDEEEEPRPRRAVVEGELTARAIISGDPVFAPELGTSVARAMTGLAPPAVVAITAWCT